MTIKAKQYTYRSGLRWTDQKKGTITSAGKPEIHVATPPEFKGHEGIWSPEDLFVSAVNVCIMSTFLAFAERAGLTFSSYSSEAEGLVELVDGKLRVTEVRVKPTVAVSDEAAAREILGKAEAHCLVSNSISARVVFEPTIVTA